MITRALICLCLFESFFSFGQASNYKNQLNKRLKTKIELERLVKEKVQETGGKTPKYKNEEPNLEWVDTSKGNKMIPSYKQSGGMPK